MSLRPATIVLLFLMLGLPGCSLHSPTIRVATFNTALSRDTAGELHEAFAQGDHDQARLVAEVLQRTRPDIVLLQEVDYDPTGKAYEDFQRNYLGQPQNGAEPIAYEYVYAPPVNTGVLAGVDLDGDGQITSPNDCYGFGRFPGHYGMVVLSKFPINRDDVISFRETLWNEVFPNNIPEGHFTDRALSRLRLSSKTHEEVPVSIEAKTLRLWISHPTPPVFDGPEDLNGRRNFDEIQFWNARASYEWFVIVPGNDKATQQQSKQRRESMPGFIILGDLNADPSDGESRPGAIDQLLGHWRINAHLTPTSQGAAEAARLQGGKNLTHHSDPAADTADFADEGRAPGNLRVDYVLPSLNLDIVDSGVYWLTTDDPHAYLNRASDHRLVWVDMRLP